LPRDCAVFRAAYVLEENRVLREQLGGRRNAARGLIDEVDGFLQDARYLIHDRDPLFSQAFRNVMALGHVKTVKLPARSPNLNAFAERFVGSIKRECVDHIVLLGERHLRIAVREYMAHCHGERNHQGVGKQLLTPLAASPAHGRRIVRHQRFGGMLNYYHREAA
jgi:hypothetical protein